MEFTNYENVGNVNNVHSKLTQRFLRNGFDCNITAHFPKNVQNIFLKS